MAVGSLYFVGRWLNLCNRGFLIIMILFLPHSYFCATRGAAGHALALLGFILFIAVIAGIVQLVEMIVERFSPSLYASLGIFLPLIAVNCAIMGASLFMQQRITLGESDPKFIGGITDAISYALGSGIGWLLAMSVWLLSARRWPIQMFPHH